MWALFGWHSGCNFFFLYLGRNICIGLSLLSNSVSVSKNVNQTVVLRSYEHVDVFDNGNNKYVCCWKIVNYQIACSFSHFRFL